MKSKILKYQIFSFIFVSIFGTLFHFVYEWSGNNPIIGAFSAVNESTWEHLKLIFFPMLITFFIGFFYIGKESNNFICSKTIGIIISLLFTVVFFYTYTGVLGKNIDVINILTFFIAVAIGEYIVYRLMISNKEFCKNNIAIIILGVLLIMFVVFTYNVPRIEIFKDPVNGKYGTHLGTVLPCTEDSANTICEIPRYLNVTLLEAGEEWIKVTYNGKEGYLKKTNIISNTVTPLITEKNRVATLCKLQYC